MAGKDRFFMTKWNFEVPRHLPPMSFTLYQTPMQHLLNYSLNVETFAPSGKGGINPSHPLIVFAPLDYPSVKIRDAYFIIRVVSVSSSSSPKAHISLNEVSKALEWPVATLTQQEKEHFAFSL